MAKANQKARKPRNEGEATGPAPAPESKILQVRFWNKQIEILEKAAAKLGLDLPKFIRDSVVGYACKSLDIGAPKLGDFPRGGKPSKLAKAAAAKGMSIAEYRKDLEERVARGEIA